MLALACMRAFQLCTLCRVHKPTTPLLFQSSSALEGSFLTSPLFQSSSALKGSLPTSPLFQSSSPFEGSSPTSPLFQSSSPFEGSLPTSPLFQSSSALESLVEALSSKPDLSNQEFNVRQHLCQVLPNATASVDQRGGPRQTKRIKSSWLLSSHNPLEGPRRSPFSARLSSRRRPSRGPRRPPVCVLLRSRRSSPHPPPHCRRSRPCLERSGHSA